MTEQSPTSTALIETPPHPFPALFVHPAKWNEEVLPVTKLAADLG